MYALAFDGKKARWVRETSEDANRAVCSMCGPLCSVNIDNHSDPLFSAEEAAKHHRKVFGQAVIERIERVPQKTL
jgi:hypothetical protein